MLLRRRRRPQAVPLPSCRIFTRAPFGTALIYKVAVNLDNDDGTPYRSEYCVRWSQNLHQE